MYEKYVNPYANPNVTNVDPALMPYRGCGGNGQGVTFSSVSAPSAMSPIAGDQSLSVIRDGLCYTEQILSDVHAAIARLEQRLDTVLTPLPPATDSTQGLSAGPPASHLAGRVSLLNRGFQDAVSRLLELAQRVEV